MSKYYYFEQFSLAQVHSLNTQLNDQTVNIKQFILA